MSSYLHLSRLYGLDSYLINLSSLFTMCNSKSSNYLHEVQVHYTPASWLSLIRVELYTISTRYIMHTLVILSEIIVMQTILQLTDEMLPLKSHKILSFTRYQTLIV